MASTSTLYSLLHHAAPNLTRHFFACRTAIRSKQTQQQCLQRPRQSLRYHSVRNTPFLQAFRSQSTSATHSAQHRSPLGQLSKTFGQKVEPAATETARRFFPSTSSKAVAYWLLGSAASVYGIVVFGGLTRLTESGLSITEWRPVTGTLPPTDAEAWEEEFAKYRLSPEFQVLNSRMNLEEFKKIYWMEYTHRLWGRFVGLSFIIPATYFIARRRVSARVARNLGAIAGLIGFQGFIGWWMVKSGLKDDLFASGEQPRVSQYRLAAHLSVAFAVYLSMLWNAITILQAHRFQAMETFSLQTAISRLTSPTIRPFRRATFLLAGLISVTAFSGALVAGLDAGLIYNEFPMMGLGLTPPKSELFSPFYARAPANADLWWRNMLENPSLVQLDHRILATSTFTAVHMLWAYARWSSRARAALSPSMNRALLAVVGLVWCQVALGISTLIYMVPLPLASMHQAGSLALLTGAVVLGRRVWVPKHVLAMMKQRVQLADVSRAKRGVSM